MDLPAAFSHGLCLPHNLTGRVRMHGVGGMGKDSLFSLFLDTGLWDVSTAVFSSDISPAFDAGKQMRDDISDA